MNLILDSHPKIWGIDENQFHFPALMGYLAMPMEATFVSFKLPNYAHIMPFIEMLPGFRVLWSIRNPLDNVFSMVKLNLNIGGLTAPWAIHPGGGGWSQVSNTYWAFSDSQKAAFSEYMKQFERLVEKFQARLRSKEGLQDVDRRDVVFMGALCWKLKNELPGLYRERGIDFHAVRYEDLVSSPKERIAEILQFIGAEWSDEVLKHHILHKGTSIGDTVNTRPIDKSGVGTGKSNLTPEEQQIVMTVCGDTALRWGYSFD